MIRDYVGHGVGAAFHSHPTIFHYKNTQPGVMQLGETFTIEPMIVQVRACVVRAATCCGSNGLGS